LNVFFTVTAPKNALHFLQQRAGVMAKRAQRVQMRQLQKISARGWNKMKNICLEKF
jgi:hypothetical protein